MNLTNEQLQAAKNGEAVSIQANGQRFVLLAEEVYDRIKDLVSYDEMDPRDTYAAVLKAWDLKAHRTMRKLTKITEGHHE